VSAYATEVRLVISQRSTSEKSNEISAIPELLNLLDLEEKIITIDAMGCQHAIAKQITDKKGDYILALKGNQGTLHDDVRTFLEDPEVLKTCPATKTTDGDHGRIETRIYKDMWTL
jgi:predicted transposase YbfD/YdcC